MAAIFCETDNLFGFAGENTLAEHAPSAPDQSRAGIDPATMVSMSFLDSDRSLENLP